MVTLSHISDYFPEENSLAQMESRRSRAARQGLLHQAKAIGLTGQQRVYHKTMQRSKEIQAEFWLRRWKVLRGWSST